MTFTVSYRGGDGKVQKMQLEAKDRNDCMAQCKEKKISPMRIEEGKGGSAAGAKKKSGALIAAGVALLAAGVAAFFMLKEKPQEPVKKVEPKKAVAQKPKPQRPKAAPKKAKPVVAEVVKEAPLPKWKYPRERTNELNEVELRKWRALNRPPPGYTNTTALTEAPPYYAIFKHRSENEIASLLTMEPGETLVGTPVYTKRLTEDFLKSFETPIEITEEDSEEDAALKRAMIETKNELKKRIDAGEDLGDILLATRSEYQDLARYKMILNAELHELKRNPDATIQDVEDFISEANKALEERGIAPITLSPISQRVLLMKKGAR